MGQLRQMLGSFHTQNQFQMHEGPQVKGKARKCREASLGEIQLRLG